MNRAANSDVFFLPDEKFDFDVSLSPASSAGEDLDDEVFVGPVGHKERCISVNVASRLDDLRVRTSWSPLSGDQLDAICEEAQKVAHQLQSLEHAQSESENTDPNCPRHGEFVPDPQATLSLFCGPPPTVLSPIKRETFCVQDSPLKQLPPAIQSRILKEQNPRASTGGKTNCRATGKPSQQPSRPRTSVSSPATGVKGQTRTSLRGRSAIGVSAVLPSRPTAPKAPQSNTNTDRSRLQPPNKQLSSSWRRSPTSSRNGSCEDLQSDSASVASDVSDCSLNSSSALAPPTKSRAVRTRSGVKGPSDGGRQKTSSSSSSVSSFNSSFSLSPANRGKRASTSGPQSKPAPTQKRRSVAVQPLNPPPSAAGRRSLSAQTSNPTPQTRKPSNPSHPTPQTRKPSNPTPMRRPETPPTHTPLQKGSERTASVPLKTKPQALVLPTPNEALRGSSSPDASQMMKPKRLISVKTVDSLPQKPMLTPSVGSTGTLQARRPSALPTPLRSRPSGLPVATPTSQARPIRALPSPSGATTSLTPTESESPESAEIPVIQPFNLEEEEPELCPPTPAQPESTSAPAQPENTSAPARPEPASEPGVPVALCISPSDAEAKKENERTQTLEPISKKQPEVLLLDLPTPALQPHEKLLIDLRNTPDLIRSRTCPSATELIDLSSPLIKWSPVDKKESDAPLINLSF